MSGWVADAGRGARCLEGGGMGEGAGRRGEGCTLEEAVGVGRRWERNRETLGSRKGEGTRRGRVSRGEGRGTESGVRESRQKWESRTLQGIKSLFVTGTVMKILCFWRERERSKRGLGGSEKRAHGWRKRRERR